MTVKQLIADLMTAPPEALVCFQGNGMWSVSGIEIGKMPRAKAPYVMLSSSGDDPYAHRPVRDKR